MKRTLTLSLLALAITGCSSMKEIEQRKTYAQPNWYQECEQHATEGWFWQSQEYVYSCGAGESKYQQASIAQAEAFALNSFAARINTAVNSTTSIEIKDKSRVTNTKVVTSINNTQIQDHTEAKKASYTKGGIFYTFVRLKMTKETFERLKTEAE
jgi:hypothetical protein